jgi:hypothetical protein
VVITDNAWLTTEKPMGACLAPIFGVGRTTLARSSKTVVIFFGRKCSLEHWHLLPENLHHNRGTLSNEIVSVVKGFRSSAIPGGISLSPSLWTWFPEKSLKEPFPLMTQDLTAERREVGRLSAYLAWCVWKLSSYSYT